MDYSNKSGSAEGKSSYMKTGQGVGGIKNPNPMSVFEAMSGSYPFCHESSTVSFDKSSK